MKINFLAICIAFVAELFADYFCEVLMIVVLGQGALTGDADSEANRRILDSIYHGGAFLTGKVILGTATTIGAGYLAARIAKRFPYYNGLGVGLIGLLFCILTWGDLPWLNVFAVLSTVPMSIYGAHLAKEHMDRAGSS